LQEEGLLSASAHEVRTEVPRHVLLVDDDTASLYALKRMMEHWGWTVTACPSFEEGRTAISEPTAPDALVVDVRLGQYNGLQLILLAKQHHPNLPVVAVSGFDDPVLRAEAAGIGATYLTKPIDLNQLREYLTPVTSLAVKDSAR
jgi:two-component system response regulator RegA